MKRTCGVCRIGDHKKCTGFYVNPAGSRVRCLCRSAACVKRFDANDTIERAVDAWKEMPDGANKDLAGLMIKAFDKLFHIGDDCQ